MLNLGAQKSRQPFEVDIPGICPSCKDKLVLNVNTEKLRVTIRLAKRPAGFAEKQRLIAHYKRVKGFDTISTWDGTYGGRAMKTATKILHFFRKFGDPVGLGIELIGDTATAAEKGSWPWNFDTCAKRADEWLGGKQRGHNGR